MPPDNKKQNDRQQKKALHDILKTWGIAGDFAALIDAAVRQDWSAGEFTHRLVRTHAFRQKFPGLIEANGSLANGVTGGEGVQATTSNLASAIGQYQKLSDAYSKVGKNYGYGAVNKHQMALLIKKEVSPDELANRLRAIDSVSKNGDQLKALAGQAGLGKTVTDRELWRLAAGEGGRNLYNQLEAAQLQTQVGLGKQEAKLAARDVGVKGAYNQQTLDQLIGYVRQNLATVGPELATQGINTARLVKVLANPGAFQQEIDKIQQVVATRKGLSSQVPGPYSQQGPGGGLTQYNQEQSAAYG